ncbi:MAG: 30S ribosomal protein THX [Bacteroidota bacterium]
MGKGDKKTKRGKIAKRTYGVRRPKPKNKSPEEIAVVNNSASKEVKKKKAPSKKEK